MSIRRWLQRRTGQAIARQQDVRVILNTAAVEAIRAESERRSPLESGGVLIGHLDTLGRTRITSATGPGPLAMHSYDRFRRDGDFTQAEVDLRHTTSQGRDDYIGEWHSHPGGEGPSRMDLQSMSWVGTNAKYDRSQPLLLIAQRARSNWRLRVYRWVQGYLEEVRWLEALD